MNLTYKNLNEETKHRYYLLLKLGQINYDLISCLSLMSKKTDSSNHLPLDLYCSKQLYVHINESYKYFNENLESYKKYINEECIGRKELNHFMDAIDFSKGKAGSNTFIKDYRDIVVHYKDDKGYQENEEIFYRYAQELKCYFPDIEKHFPDTDDIEVKSLMLLLNMFVIEKGITPEDYPKIMMQEAYGLITIIKNMEINLLNELENDDLK